MRILPAGTEIGAAGPESSWFERFINLKGGKDLDFPLVHSINIKGVYVRLLPEPGQFAQEFPVACRYGF